MFFVCVIWFPFNSETMNVFNVYRPIIHYTVINADKAFKSIEHTINRLLPNFFLRTVVHWKLITSNTWTHANTLSFAHHAHAVQQIVLTGMCIGLFGQRERKQNPSTKIYDQRMLIVHGKRKIKEEYGNNKHKHTLKSPSNIDVNVFWKSHFWSIDNFYEHYEQHQLCWASDERQLAVKINVSH